MLHANGKIFRFPVKGRQWRRKKTLFLREIQKRSSYSMVIYLYKSTTLRARLGSASDHENSEKKAKTIIRHGWARSRHGRMSWHSSGRNCDPLHSNDLQPDSDWTMPTRGQRMRKTVLIISQSIKKHTSFLFSFLLLSAWLEWDTPGTIINRFRLRGAASQSCMKINRLFDLRCSDAALRSTTMSCTFIG